MACEKKYKLSKTGADGRLGAARNMGENEPVGLAVSRLAGGGPAALSLAQGLSHQLLGSSAGREEAAKQAHHHCEDQSIQ